MVVAMNLDELADVLEDGTWDTRVAALTQIAAAFPMRSASEVLALLKQTDPFFESSTDPDEAQRERGAVVLAGVAEVVRNLGRPEIAERMARRALLLAPQGLSPARARAEHILGSALRDMRRWTEAVEHLQIALRLYQRAEDSAGAGRVFDTLGGVHFGKLELHEAEYCYRQGMTVKREIGDYQGQAIGLGNLCRIALLRGNYEDALDLAFQDLALSQDLSDRHGISLACAMIADAWLKLGELDRAADAIAKAEEAARTSPRPLDLAHALRYRALLSLAAGATRAAAEPATQARQGYLASRSPAGVVQCDIILSRVDRMEGRLEAALARLEAAQRVAQGDTALEAELCFEASLVHATAGDAPRQREALGRGLKLVERVDVPQLQKSLHIAYTQVELLSVLPVFHILDETELAHLVEDCYRRREGVGNALLKRGILQPGQLGTLLGQMGYSQVSGPDLVRLATRAADGAFPQKTAERICAVPLSRGPSRMRVAMADPLHPHAIAQLEANFGCPIEVVYATESEIRRVLLHLAQRKRLGLTRAPNGLAAAESLFAEIVRIGASDVHVEPKRLGVLVRARVDGVLHEVDWVDRELGSQLIGRLKVMASLDITERRRPQDGRSAWERGSTSRSLRVSTYPTLHGEKVVVRVLEQDGTRELQTLGFSKDVESAIRRLVSRRDGLVLVVGPTGSGKTTTLYAALGTIDSLARSVATVEDPVEYEVESFAQSAIHPNIGYSFPEALKALLRQDPDVLLLGEMRDLESASIATRMALTGALVLSTLHAYDSTTAVTRLLEMGVPAFALVGVLRAVLAQRLVRRLCPVCRAIDDPPHDLIRAVDPSREPHEVLKRAKFFRPVGCEACNSIGYKGRVPVYEYLELTPELLADIRPGMSATAFRERSLGQGLVSLQSSVLNAAMAGETSLTEALRVM